MEQATCCMERYKAIGHMYSIPATAGEAFYLCTLLTVVKGMIAYGIYIA